MSDNMYTETFNLEPPASASSTWTATEDACEGCEWVNGKSVCLFFAKATFTCTQDASVASCLGSATTQAGVDSASYTQWLGSRRMLAYGDATKTALAMANSQALAKAQFHAVSLTRQSANNRAKADRDAFSKMSDTQKQEYSNNNNGKEFIDPTGHGSTKFVRILNTM